jgi:serine/threonine protein kinase
VSADWPTVPGYEILQELGRGGMGVVYKARQLNLGRLVALKMIRDGALAGPQQRARFRIEAEAAARMQHANVVRIYEVADHAGRPYFVMELIEGERLDQHLAGQAWPAPRAAELVRTLALAVQHAHEQKIVHRDLKPANILLQGLKLTVDSGNPHELLESTFGIPKITDFGLAKRLDADSTGWTPEGAVVGTPNYMAPEQAAGRVSDIGPAADVYALGVMLYEALTGRPPFRSDSWSETIRQVLQDEPTPPTRLQLEVPRDLETVCLKCLEKDPAKRYASARELADDLDRFLQAKPVTAVAPSVMERLARLATRDGYQIFEEIGRGPRSTVYRACYGRLRQPMALKVFITGVFAQEEWETRVRNDAERLATLTHPQIVPVQRAGWWDGAAYLAREFVPQGSLAVKLAGRTWSTQQAVGLVEQLAVIVSYIHRQGVIHANLKPANVLLAANDIPRLVDFRLTGSRAYDRLPADEQAADLGYMAPELVRDQSAEPRPYTDIYGLGIILYELLAGRPPFVGANARETVEQILAQDPIPPSHFNPGIPPPLDWLCMHCLKKNPWRRYSRAYDVATRLRRILDEILPAGSTNTRES